MAQLWRAAPLTAVEQCLPASFSSPRGGVHWGLGRVGKVEAAAASMGMLATELEWSFSGGLRRQVLRKRGVVFKKVPIFVALPFSPATFRWRLSRLECQLVDDDREVEKEEDGSRSKQDEVELGLPFLRRWDIPWDGKATTVGMVCWFGSFLLTGLAVAVISSKVGFGRRQSLDMDEQALFVLVHQMLQTIVGLGVINLVISPYKPLPDDIFRFDGRSPFNLQRGWLLWGGLGVFLAGASVVGAGVVTSFVAGQPPPREEADALAQLLPLIAASPASTASLIVVTGVLAPVLEESVFRGFLLTSLSKWMPVPVAVAISASAFALAHLTPTEFPQLFALGRDVYFHIFKRMVLGFSYSQTRNLLTPIFIHSMWNSGVVVLLTLLRLRGYDISELL